MKRIFPVAAALLACIGSSPALADDWTLSCLYDQNVLVEIKYDAGVPSYSAAIRLNGSTKLQAHRALVPAARLTAPHSYIFIVDRERTGMVNERSFVIRLDTDTMKSTIEAGNGVPWDFISLKGNCSLR